MTGGYGEVRNVNKASFHRNRHKRSTSTREYAFSNPPTETSRVGCHGRRRVRLPLYVRPSLEYPPPCVGITSPFLVKENVEKTKAMLRNVVSDVTSLDAKKEKKNWQLEMNQRRLQTLQSVRPLFMDEYEKIEEQLEEQYKIQVENFANYYFLESQREKHLKQEKMFEEENARRRTTQQLKRGGDCMSPFNDDDTGEDKSQDGKLVGDGCQTSDHLIGLPLNELMAGPAIGNMLAAESDESEDSDRDEDEEDEDESTEIEGFLKGAEARMPRTSGGGTKHPLLEKSDDDF